MSIAPHVPGDERNEPIPVGRVGEALAATRGVAVEEVARASTRNARRLFRMGG